jgi:hypothetical protein
MKWPQIVFVLLGVLAVALAVRNRREPAAPTAAPSPVVVPAPSAPEERPLPPSFDRPGMVSRLVGLLRTYLAVPEEIVLPASAASPDERTTRVPILVVFENETYRPLRAADAGWIGNLLGTLRVARVPDRGAEVEVFQAELPLPARADWLSAERRSVTVDWPLPQDPAALAPGLYKVALRLALPEEPILEIYTQLR